MNQINMALPARFWDKVAVDSNSCWLWTAHIDRSGYARFHWDGRQQLGHRVAYEAIVGSITDDLVLDHLCRVRRCVNPDHLEPVTGRENTHRGEGHGNETHCPSGHPYDAANTYTDPRGCRRCRACNRAAARDYRARKAVA